MNRRGFLRGLPIGAVAAALPVASTVVAAVTFRENEVPMRGEYANVAGGTGTWKMMELSTHGLIPNTEFVSHCMRLRPDGTYELLFDRIV